jgi:hypothetical protein
MDEILFSGYATEGDVDTEFFLDPVASIIPRALTFKLLR